MIGNREIWDKGIGMGATQAVFGGQSSSPNYDPLMSDPNAKPPEPTVETAAPELGETAAPAQPTANPNQQKIDAINRRIIDAEFEIQRLRIHQPSQIPHVQRQLIELRRQLAQLQYGG